MEYEIGHEYTHAYGEHEGGARRLKLLWQSLLLIGPLLIAGHTMTNTKQAFLRLFYLCFGVASVTCTKTPDIHEPLLPNSYDPSQFCTVSSH